MKNPSVFPFKSEIAVDHPQGREIAGEIFHPGMLLKDYFAGQAMTGLCIHGTMYTIPAMAKKAYALADAMIKEREL